jgi:hypothetical protein
LLNLSARHFRRLCGRYDEEGIEGLKDRRLGKPSPRRAPASELCRMQTLYRGRYHDFSVKRFHEQLRHRHHFKLGHTMTRLSLQASGTVRRAPRREPHRRRRERRPLPGMPLFQDGSSHRWRSWLGRDLDHGGGVSNMVQGPGETIERP